MFITVVFHQLLVLLQRLVLVLTPQIFYCFSLPLVPSRQFIQLPTVFLYVVCTKDWSTVDAPSTSSVLVSCAGKTCLWYIASSGSSTVDSGYESDGYDMTALLTPWASKSCCMGADEVRIEQKLGWNVLPTDNVTLVSLGGGPLLPVQRNHHPLVLWLPTKLTWFLRTLHQTSKAVSIHLNRQHVSSENTLSNKCNESISIEFKDKEQMQHKNLIGSAETW